MNNRIENIAIVGGTHGNELTGVYLIKKWMKNKSLVVRETFSTKLLYGNLKAIKEVRRYIDYDLNRSFKLEALEGVNEDIYESIRANDINNSLGKKGEKNTKVDFILDLHTTTSNMGLSIVVSNDSKLTWQSISYLCDKVPSLNIYRWEGDEEKAFLDSIAPHGFAIEVGSIPQGVLRADLFLETEKLVMHLLDFFEQYNNDTLKKRSIKIEYYDHIKLVDYPRDNNGDIVAMVHSDRQDKDYELISKGDALFLTLDGDTIVYDGDESLYGLFINEAAYYEKGFAMCLARKRVKSINFD